ncbi:MAG TPA: uracil-DNA glycosylase family protein, partial [Acidimicrobiales bacterium]|nr:uracil-DNA glycosylase family protein [Acidimicrobiales bacterium]
EGPGAEEDRLGKPWQGKAGKVLQEALSDLKVDLVRDCVSVNSVNCRLPGNRVPTPHEMACCRNKIVQPAIDRTKPRVVILLGGSAVSSVLGSIYPGAEEQIGKWRGNVIPVPEWGCWVCPTFHPSYIMREERRREIRTVWEQDLERAVAQLSCPVPEPEDLRALVTILRTEDEVCAALERVLRRKGLFSFDYETTGLRAILHRPVCASFAQSPNRAYSFMFRGSERVAALWRAVLEDPEIGKISHNLKFEDSWSRAHFGVREIEWAWDGLLAAHVLDQRPGICGLKHQAFLHFGIRGYDDLISPYLKSTDDRDPAAENRIFEFIERYGEDECLIYCGLDSLVEMRLALRQREAIGVK